ncbi:putative histone-lysine N-methyltransferase PRDM6 [Montipora foliosa]|uniref:putative histone-lysine N-methyltransferase PRDM6 n=1 Tax=Montipora foliosa TaxID=591990 RepID=UPI0035F1FFBC
MEETSSTQPKSEQPNPCSSPTVVKKSCSSSLQEQISLQILQHALFGSKPVKIVNIKNTSHSSDDEWEHEISQETETDNGRTLKTNLKLSYAVASFPDEVNICTSSIPGTNYGVCAKQHIPVGTWIGPYEGKCVRVDDVTTDMNTSHMWEIYEDNQLNYFLDGSDKNTSSWMRFIRCARHKQEQNLFAFQHNKSIFYRAFRDIPRGCELLVWYEDSYMQHMGIPVGIGNKSPPLQVPGRVSSDSRQSGDPEIFEKAQKRCAPDRSGLHRGRKRRSSTQTVFNLLLEGMSDECSASLSKRQNKGCPANHDNRNNISVAFGDVGGKMLRGNAHYKKLDTSEHDGLPRKGRMTDDALDNIADGGEFKCGQCKKTFAQRSLLNNHLCSRMPCKPYRCGHCQEAFAQPRELRMHAVIHVSEKPFKCGYCLRAFSGATTLNNHVRTHTGEKPFLCEVCGKSFSQAFQLSRHRRICVQSTD